MGLRLASQQISAADGHLGLGPSVRKSYIAPCRGVAQPGSASGLGPEGRKFESCLPDHYIGDLQVTDVAKNLVFIITSANGGR